MKKEKIKELCKQHTEEISKLQEVLYADKKYSVLIILQGLDTAGKDGVIKHVMAGLNPQGCQVSSFKSPTDEELKHDFLWRCSKCLPERGTIGIFNRSYYEEVLAVKVHPEYLISQNIPGCAHGQDGVIEKIWKDRYTSIRNFEKHLVKNGTRILKFYIEIDKETQKERILERVNDPDKHWKLSIADLKERKYWDNYILAFKDVVKYTSTKFAPWHVIDSNDKWKGRLNISDIIIKELQSLDLKYPTVTEKQKENLLSAKEQLENEK